MKVPSEAPGGGIQEFSQHCVAVPLGRGAGERSEQAPCLLRAAEGASDRLQL